MVTESGLVVWFAVRDLMVGCCIGLGIMVGLLIFLIKLVFYVV